MGRAGSIIIAAFFLHQFGMTVKKSNKQNLPIFVLSRVEMGSLDNRGRGVCWLGQ